MPKMRVLLFMHALDSTGAPRVALDIFQALKDEVDLQILSLDGGNLEDQFRALGSVKVLSRSIVPGADRRAAAGLLPRGAALRLNGRLAALSRRRFKPDLVYINSAAALPVARYVGLPSVPLILHVHEIGTALEAHLGNVNILPDGLPCRYIVPSRAVQQLLVDQWKVSSSDIVLISSFIATHRFPELHTFTRATGIPVVGGGGRISWCKGADLWLLMAAELTAIRGRDNIRFRWVGLEEKEEDKQFRVMARKLRIEDCIDFVPVTPHPLVHFQDLSAFAMTSWEESASLVTLENMVLGTPVLCFGGSGGPPELVGDAGITIQEFSPPDMAKAIAVLLDDERRRIDLGRAACQRVLNNYTDTVQIPRILEELRKSAS